MGYADGYYYGQGKIICDTATFTAGDTIRVRSMTDATKIWDKTVVTAGTPLIFEVPGKDYYKICTVQTISDVETEIGGVYKTIDYGQTLFINVLDKTTLGGIQGILNAHQEGSLLAIGDEVDITVNGNPWTMQIAGINIYHDHDVMLTSKHIWTTEVPKYDYTSSGYARTDCQTFYSDISSEERQYIKEVTRSCRQTNGTVKTYDDYCFVLGNKETLNEANYGFANNQVQMPLFVTAANRIKTFNGTAMGYWTSDDYNTTNGVIYVTSSGILGLAGSGNLGVVPSFMLIADS